MRVRVQNNCLSYESKIVRRGSECTFQVRGGGGATSGRSIKYNSVRYVGQSQAAELIEGCQKHPSRHSIIELSHQSQSIHTTHDRDCVVYSDICQYETMHTTSGTAHSHCCWSSKMY